MSFRRDSRDDRRWGVFRDSHSELLAATGMPLEYYQSEALFIDFLMHGHIDHHHVSQIFTSEVMTQRQYDALRKSAWEYFNSGFGYFEPIALRMEADIRAFDREFAKTKKKANKAEMATPRKPSD